MTNEKSVRDTKSIVEGTVTLLWKAIRSTFVQDAKRAEIEALIKKLEGNAMARR